MIYVIRHGETALNAAAVVQPDDTPLNERGQRQARLLAARIRDLGVTHVIASDLPRAVATAEAIVLATSASLECTALLRERNFGDVRGTPYSEIDQDIFAPAYEPPNGESCEVFDDRVREAWAHVVETREGIDGDLAVVTHGLVCRSLLFLCLQPPTGAPVPGPFANASLTIVQPSAPHHVRLLDCVAHLEEAEAEETAG